MFSRSAILLLFILLSPLPLLSQEKSLTIIGLRVYEEKDLVEKLRLWQYESGHIEEDEVINRISRFYKSKGYPLIRSYIVKGNRNELKIFVDEGRIGKILFLKTDTIKLFWLRYKFTLEGNVFNTFQMKKNMHYIRDVKGYNKSFYKLKRAKNFDDSIFQLDMKLKIPLIGETQLPFFEQFGARYDLDITIEKDHKTAQKNEKGNKQRRVTINRFRYGINVHYSKGFVPRLKYYSNGLVYNGDLYTADFSFGIMYGINGKFSQWPTWTFFRLKQEYWFPPTFRDYFTPLINTLFLYSRASRIDLDLAQYELMTINSIFAPGITLLSRLRIYTGIGVEIVQFHNSVAIEGTTPERNIERRVDIFNYVETGLSLELAPIRLGDPLEKNIRMSYAHYFMNTSFNLFQLNIEFSFELTNRSIYSFKLAYTNVWEGPPFHHESSVSNGAFKGFNGLGYHSRGLFSVSNEYLLSIYRDYIYVGAYFDTTVFQGSGYDLSGLQSGIVGGPTFRILFLDQIEFSFYYGWDYLFSSGDTQGNIGINLVKKW